MGKRSRRHLRWHEKNKLGCMWSWMSMFDFGNSKGAHKLLSDMRLLNLNASAYNAPNSKLKLLKDVEENGQGSKDCIGSRGQVCEANQLSVKRLIEVEIGTNNKKRNKISIPESEAGRIIRRDQKLLNETCKASSKKAPSEPDVGESLGSGDCGSDLYIEAIIQEIFSYIQQKSVNWSKNNQQGETIQSKEKLSLLEERISEATKVIMRQKFLNGDQLTGDRKVHYYNKYIDTLEMLNTNKEFFLKLSEDRNSSFMKQFKKMPGPNLNQIHSDDVIPSEEIGSRSQHMFFMRKLSSQNGDKINDKRKPSEASNKIVILKPERTESHASTSASSPIVRYNAASQFSFREIRRKLRLATGKGQHGTSSTEVATANPYKNQKLRIGDKPFSKDQPGISSPRQKHFYVKKLPRPLSGLNMGNKVKNKHDVSSKQRVSSIYIEAKRHLSELLNNGDEDEGLSSRHTPETLENLLSVPEHNLSPPRNPVSDLTNTKSTTQESSSHIEGQCCNNISQEIEADYEIELVHLSARSSEIDLCSSDDNSGNVSEACNTNSSFYMEGKKEELFEAEELERTSSAISYELILQGDMEDVRATETAPQLADSETNVIYEPTSMTSSVDQIICTSEIYEVQACSRWDEQDTHDEYIPSSPEGQPSFSAINIITDNLASPMDKSERPSPISVLEHVFSEDEISPAGESHACNVEPRRLRPICIQFDEDEVSSVPQGAHIQGSLDNKELVSRYVEAIMLSSEFCWEEYYITSLLSNQLLDKSLFEKVHILFYELSYDDLRLLFDCVSEVLNRMCQRYFGGCPLVSFSKLNIRPIPEPEKTIQEVLEGVEWHLLLPPPPRSLEQIVRKDLERDTLWMDLRFDLEGASVDMETIILEDLMDETVLSCIEILLRDENSPSQFM